MVTFRPPDSDAGNTQTDRGKLRVRPHSRTPVRRPARRAEAFTGLIESGCDCRPQRTSAIGAGSAQPYYALRTDLARSRWRLRTTAQMQSLPSLNLTPDRPRNRERRLPELGGEHRRPLARVLDTVDDLLVVGRRVSLKRSS